MQRPNKRELLEVLKDVPPSKLGEVIADYEDSGARVTPRKQPSGSYDVEAVFTKVEVPEPSGTHFFLNK